LCVVDVQLVSFTQLASTGSSQPVEQPSAAEAAVATLSLLAGKNKCKLYWSAVKAALTQHLELRAKPHRVQNSLGSTDKVLGCAMILPLQLDVCSGENVANMPQEVCAAAERSPSQPKAAAALERAA
jgi:hypothetical protein